MTVPALLPSSCYQLCINTISAKGLRKTLNPLPEKKGTYAIVSIEGDKKIGKQITPINEKGGTNPTWSNAMMRFFVQKADVHGDFLSVVVVIEGSSIFNCVAEVRIKDMMKDNIRAGVAALDVRSTLRLQNPKEIITISYEIKEIADLQVGHVVPYPAAVVPTEVTSTLDELTPLLDVAPPFLGPANPPMTSSYYLPQGAPAAASPTVAPLPSGYNSSVQTPGGPGPYPQFALVTGFPPGYSQPGAYPQSNSQPGVHQHGAPGTAFPAGQSLSAAYPQAFPAGISQPGPYSHGVHGFPPHHPGISQPGVHLHGAPVTAFQAGYSTSTGYPQGNSQQGAYPPHHPGPHPGHSFQPYPPTYHPALQQPPVRNSTGIGSWLKSKLCFLSTHTAGIMIPAMMADDDVPDLDF
ncbi:hypothetical protein POM88_053925 [Heracleum sosnowskyi]|uniref:C2 domain-containing protein n=1 Tax=Heracleum sosnowskyi TaxID=360622 RepID=A0AAD8GN84_9APIA|nr:hypothetical protein POM88_053925 [Heracleum sosnowskyi]